MIDAHQHFWRLSRPDYLWPNETVAPIFRDFEPEELPPLLEAAGVRQTVLVQANDTLAETDFILDIAARTPWVAAVVGWVNLKSPDAITTVDRLRQHPKLRGLRPMLQNITDTDWILDAAAAPALAHMEAAGLCFDALVQPRHLGTIAELADRYPSLPIVIDHIAKPKMGNRVQPDPSWTQGMLDLSSHPNVCCKLSGMISEIGHGWQQSDLEPFVRSILFAFGPKRVMWGSDWPVVNLAGDYMSWFNVSQELTRNLSWTDRDFIFEKTARLFYGIGGE